MYETNTTHFDKKFIDELSADTGHPFINDITRFEELMMMYSCAIKEVQTKLEVLNMDFGVRYRRNPIEFIKTRLKRPDSIAKKLNQKGCPVAVSAIRPNLNDVAGIRVICSFIDDIYAVAEQLIGQDDVTLIEAKDYISHPKENGYRSLHLIVQVPVFFADYTRDMNVEVQIRTIAMDFWASLDHKLKYKHSLSNPEEISRELKECAESIAVTDEHMQLIKNKIYGESIQPKKKREDFEGKL